MPSWSRTWPPNGSRRIRAKQKLHKKPKEACTSSWMPMGSQNSCTLTIPWNSAKLVEIFPKIIARLHTDQTQMGLLKEQCAQSKGRHLCRIVAIRSEWKLVGRFHGMLYQRAKRQRSIIWLEDAPWKTFGQSFKEPIIPFGTLVEYHPITAKDQSRIHQFGKKVLPGLVLGNALYAARIWKGDVLVADLEELETMDASEI